MKHITPLIFCMMSVVTGCQQSASTPDGLNHPAGQYPGNPAEDFAPVVQRSRSNEYRNLAHLRPAYHSSSYDYNLTAQLVTDGIVSSEKPWWIRVSSQDGEISKQQREYLLDGMPWSAIKSGDKQVMVQIDMPQHELLADEVHLRGRITLPKGQMPRQEAQVLASQDGQNWV